MENGMNNYTLLKNEEAKEDASAVTVLGTFGAWALVFVIGLIAFNVFSNTKSCFHYARTPSSSSKTRKRRSRWCNCGWVIDVWRVREKEVAAVAGVDAVMFLRFQLLLAKMCLICGALGCFVLVPIYETATDDKATIQTGMDSYTVSNIPAKRYSHSLRGNPRLWAPCVLVTIFYSLAFYLLNIEWQVYLRLHHDHLSRPSPHNYTVMVKELPLHLRSNIAVRRYFTKLYPGSFHAAHIVRHLPVIARLNDLRSSVALELEEAVAAWHKTGLVQMVPVKQEDHNLCQSIFGMCTKKVAQ